MYRHFINTTTGGFRSSEMVNYDTGFVVPDVSKERDIFTFNGQEFQVSLTLEDEGTTA